MNALRLRGLRALQRQAAVVAYLRRGCTVQGVAGLLGIHERSVYKILARPGVRQELAAVVEADQSRQDTAVLDALDRLRTAATTAPSKRTRFAADRAIIETALGLSGTSRKTTLPVLRKRVDALERRIRKVYV